MVITATAPDRKVSADEAREVAEAAREQEWAAPSFVRDLFLGRLRLDLVHPYPEQDAEEIRRAQPFLEKVVRFLRGDVYADRIDREGEIPEAVMQGLRELGAFGIKIPREYGGLGLSQLSYMRAIALVSSIDGSITALLSAHQSIGVPQPLKMFGSAEQKQRYLPRLAKGAISAFALTEPGVGSDPAAMETMATPSEDGKAWILNGEKLWCTNGTKAELMVVMARTPSKTVNGKEKRQITAFIVETTWPGVKVEHRCHFMGLKAIYNGVISFKNVRVPRENVLWGEGKGLKLALITLNTGRLTLPISSVAAGKRCLEISRRWAVERIMRDFRINLIFEGSSEIMHLFIAREAVDKHLQVAGDVVLPGKALGQRLRGLVRAGLFYAWWYPSRWLGWGFWPKYGEFGPLARHLRAVERGARRLARGVFHAMVRFGPKLEYRQSVLFRLVDVGAELFAMAAACARAQWLLRHDPAAGRRAVELADLFCRQARARVHVKFRELGHNADMRAYRVAQETLAGEHRWLERGMIELE